jgi:hypothetical protein
MASSTFNLLPSIPQSLSSAAQSLNKSLGLPTAKGLYRNVIPSAFSQNTGGAPLFRISVYDPQKILYATYLFPISPQNIGRSSVSMATVYDTQGTTKENGVHRVIDEYGQAPPTWTLRGTTGYQYHNTDNYQYTGWQSLETIRTLIESFAALNSSQSEYGFPLYTMELSNYYDNEFWEVVPVGPQNITREANRPIWGYYDFTFVGIKPIQSPESTATDPVLSALSLSFNTVLQGAITFASSIAQSYYPATIVSTLIAKSKLLTTGNNI